jgi:GNAT superfamily N-acetyltransferase
MVYTVDDIAIKKLEEEDLEALADFCSSYSELEEFLKDDAFRDQSVNVSVTYLVYDREERLLAYITLLSDSLRIKRDEELREHFRDLGIYYPYLPALKIGRLCVRDEYWRNNLGTLLLQFAVRVAWEISERCGCRFVTIPTLTVE